MEDLFCQCFDVDGGVTGVAHTCRQP